MSLLYQIRDSLLKHYQGAPYFQASRFKLGRETAQAISYWVVNPSLLE